MCFGNIILYFLALVRSLQPGVLRGPGQRGQTEGSDSIFLSVCFRNIRFHFLIIILSLQPGVLRGPGQHGQAEGAEGGPVSRGQVLRLHEDVRGRHGRPDQEEVREVLHPGE